MSNILFLKTTTSLKYQQFYFNLNTTKIRLILPTWFTIIEFYVKLPLIFF